MNNRGKIAGMMISILVMLIVTPMATSAASVPMYSNGYAPPPDHPVASNVVITPHNPVVGDVIACSYDFYDQDGSPDHSTISWRLINNTGGYFIASGSSLDTSNIKGGSVVECYVDAYDGINWGNEAKSQIVIGENASRNTPLVAPSIIYLKNNQSIDSSIIYDGDIVEMSHREQFEWNISLMKLNQNKKFRIVAYINNDSTGIVSIGSQYITTNNPNASISFNNLSFEFGNGCYVATIMIFQVSNPGKYHDYLDFVIDVGNNDCSPYEANRNYNHDCITCPKIHYSYLDANYFTQKNYVRIKNTGLYPGKEYTMDSVLINEDIPAIIMSESTTWNATYGAKAQSFDVQNLTVGSYCVISNMYENGTWIDSERTCRIIEEPEPAKISYTTLKFNDYHIEHYVETRAVNLWPGKTYGLEVELINETSGQVIISTNDTRNVTYNKWTHYMDRVTLDAGDYCMVAKLYESGVVIDNETRCVTVNIRTPYIRSNSISYDEYKMSHKTYTKVSGLTPNENYTIELSLVNIDTGIRIITETHDWSASYGARTFRMYDIDLGIGEFCLTATLYESGVEVDQRVSCTKVICQYEGNGITSTAEKKDDPIDEPSIIEDFVDAIVDIVSEIFAEIFAETKSEEDIAEENEQSVETSYNSDD